LNEGGSFKSSSLLLVDPDFFTNAMLLRSQLKAAGPGAVCPVLNARSNNRRMAFYHAIFD
jgi:hypothetical protein